MSVSARCSRPRLKNVASTTETFPAGAGIDEVFVQVNRKAHYLWCAVDHKGEVLEVCATNYRDRRAARNFLKRVPRRFGRLSKIVTEQLHSYRATTKILGNSDSLICTKWLNIRAENSHQPFRRREGAISKIRDAQTLQKFSSIQAAIHNHFNLERIS